VTPGDGGAQGLLSQWYVPRPAGQKAEAAVEAPQDFLGSYDLGPRCSKLDGEWNSVESPTDFGDGF
jgi:hypothetical protein